ncbi:hypothetical protein TVAG_342040 [Trichomonas vaginalis G3]|uniref:GP63-like n=1 Tax=Trichomonas vaginalis (strain ATCC PRA-98 / G3) TaxID=412133 RepID=A2EUS4_TRIV3|nr:regulation of choline O-acetyltransferase protein [Trichomonas vaginalis G3]EAY03602.1 hypothetical protein TVAG_342040 [Trichomonas vaginalis G3]KAI5505773.1 regulation of choline O-acetyltransferase protein [Trichomonas vaginalis G3]|eukprot:XP_001315825.1 hypothetical protein [Trichomonas vaginalis G3]
MTHPYPDPSSISSTRDSYYFDTKYYEVNQMTIILNPRQIPIHASQVNTQNDLFFNYLMAAILTGIVPSDHFHLKLSTDYFPNPICTLTKDGIQFRVLITPYAHHHGKNFFGQEWFVGDDKTCPSGIILHPTYMRPNTAFYPEDLSVSTNIQEENVPFLRFTEVTMAFLLDSGNYEVDWRYGKPPIFGNKDFISGEYIPNWPLGPPISTLPKYYFKRPNVTLDGGSFTFKTWGKFYKYLGNCTSSSISSNYPEYCSHQNYYNPYNYQEFGPSYMNYAIIKGISSLCPDGTATIPRLTFYTNDDCAVYSCSDDYSSFTLDVLVNQKTNQYTSFQCTYEEQTHTFDKTYEDGAIATRTLVCPPTEAFCRTLERYDKLYQKNPFQNVIFPTPTPFVTPMITATETPVLTPANTTVLTPKITPKITPRVTVFNTPFHTAQITPFKTPCLTPGIESAARKVYREKKIMIFSSFSVSYSL